MSLLYFLRKWWYKLKTHVLFQTFQANWTKRTKHSIKREEILENTS